METKQTENLSICTKS